ncbi:MAG: DUF4332 domain-containing protein [Candidatus Hermodarchaeota archaeon]|nr:DUF4332 domain-containing protein [Candidatus Hermodarchaeota archaeon]
MDEDGFRQFLKRGGRTPHTIDNVVKIVRFYEAYLDKFAEGKVIEQATPDDLVTYVDWFEREEEKSAKGQLWAIRYYYRFINNKPMVMQVSELREERTAMTRKSFKLRNFLGINTTYVEKLEALGIHDVNQMRTRGRTPDQRRELSIKTDIPEEIILELVKLSDLARLPGVKGIRARLYYNAGIDTVEKMAEQNPDTLLVAMREFVEETGFEGIAPLPKEIESSINTAKKLPKEIEY